ncbi:MAG: phosphoribosyl-ATP diphosphatase [Deltaproteobacteria bacterium]|nr:phosphoribosyl-ATP diphosphatase [Deltaproteobacteria bacterium]
MSSDASAEILERLYEVVVARRDERPEGSYVVQLLDGGWSAIGAKIREEAGEVVEAGTNESDSAVAHEAADLIFHLWVGLAARDVDPREVFAELGRRFGIGGLAEKASRGAKKEG